MLPSVYHTTPDHTSSPIGYNINHLASSYSISPQTTHLPSMVYSLNQEGSQSTTKLPSIHQLTNRTIMSPKENQLQVPQQLPMPSHVVSTPSAPSQSTFAHHDSFSTPPQSRFPIVSLHAQQLQQLRSPVTRQYVFAQNSPISPVSPILSPYAVRHPVEEGSYNSPNYPASLMSPPSMPTGTIGNTLASPYNQHMQPIEVRHRVNRNDASQATLATSQTPLETKTTPSKVKKLGKSDKRKRRKSASNGSIKVGKSHTKTGSSIYNRKPRQTLVFNEKAIHYPVHKDFSSLTTANKIPSANVQQLNTTIYPNIDTKKYATSALDPQRNFLTVFEYMINDHWVIWDYETGYVHLTGIWKASLCANGAAPPSASHMKADIVKLLESTPKQYQAYIKRIRGGFLKIQGTWLPFRLCKVLAKRFCYHIRFALIPIFGVDFPESCLQPNDTGYGELRLDDLKNCKVDLAESISNYSEENPKEEEEHVKVSTNAQQPRDSRSSSPVMVELMNQQNPIKLEQSTSLVSPVSINNSKFVNVEQLPPVGTFSPTSAGPLLDECSPQQTESYNYKHQTPSTSTAVWHNLGQNQSTSTSSESLSSIFTEKSTVPPTARSKCQSYTDLLEIVNASKCLQSLSQKRANGINKQLPPIDRLKSSNGRSAWEDETDDEGPVEKVERNQKMEDGISSILLAAELNKSFAYNNKPRSGLSIKDLTT
ncbi:unnamed protein product [Candida parapsilosis]